MVIITYNDSIIITTVYLQQLLLTYVIVNYNFDQLPIDTRISSKLISIYPIVITLSMSTKHRINYDVQF